MNLDTMVKSKKRSIRLILKNATGADMKLGGYMSSAPPLSQLPDMLNHSNEDASDNLGFELIQDSEHGIWLRYRYVDNEARGFDIRIHASFSTPQDIAMNTNVYYIDGQDEKNILSREATYTMYNTEEATPYHINVGTPNENVEEADNLKISAYVQHRIVNTYD
jgi:hypothetical protein